MATVNTMEIVGKFVELLTPLPSDERQRIVSATLVLLGETTITPSGSAANDDLASNDVSLPQRAQLWMKQNQLTDDEIEQVFHITGTDIDIIAHEIPGKSNREKTLSAYILTGISQLLSTGEPSFDDKRARALCRTAGCYSEANHALYLRDRGNEISGSKERGWVLTAPGLKRAASLIKEITKPNS